MGGCGGWARCVYVHVWISPVRFSGEETVRSVPRSDDSDKLVIRARGHVHVAIATPVLRKTKTTTRQRTRVWVQHMSCVGILIKAVDAVDLSFDAMQLTRTTPLCRLMRVARLIQGR